MNDGHVFWFSVILAAWLLFSKKMRADDNFKDFGDDWFGSIKYYGVSIFLFMLLGGFVVFFDSNQHSGTGQVSVFTGQGSAKNYRLDATMILNPDEDMLSYFKKDKYEIDSVTWPNGGEDSDMECVVQQDDRSECDIDGRTYYVEVTSFTQDDDDYEPQ